MRLIFSMLSALHTTFAIVVLQVSFTQYDPNRRMILILFGAFELGMALYHLGDWLREVSQSPAPGSNSNLGQELWCEMEKDTGRIPSTESPLSVRESCD